MPLSWCGRDREIGHHNFRGSGLQLVRRQLEPLHRANRRDIEVAVSGGDPGRALVAESFGDVHLAVAVRVAKSHHTGATLTTLRRDIKIAVGHGDHVTGSAEIIGNDQRAEALRKFQPAVVGIARRQPRCSNVHYNCRSDYYRRGTCRHETFHEFPPKAYRAFCGSAYAMYSPE